MQMISEIMTRDVQFVSPQENLQRAAQLMDDLNVGVLPVCDGDRLVGMITDRDITVRSTSTGTAPDQARVGEVMSADVRWCFEDQSVDEVMQQMQESQIRRVPVVSHDDAHKLIGIVALGDLATKVTDDAAQADVSQVVDKVSSPSEPDRSQTGNTASPGSLGGSASFGTGGQGGGAALESSAAGSEGGDVDAVGGSISADGTPQTDETDLGKPR